MATLRTLPIWKMGVFILRYSHQGFTYCVTVVRHFDQNDSKIEELIMGSSHSSGRGVAVSRRDERLELMSQAANTRQKRQTGNEARP